MPFETDASRAVTDAPRPFLTDGGFETTMLFHEGHHLPAFAACVLLDDPAGRASMRAYFDRYLALAEEAGTGFVLDTNTWRSGLHWAGPVGQSEADMLRLTREAVRFADDIRDAWSGRVAPILLNGVVGPAGDAYAADSELTADAAQVLHLPQIKAMAAEGIDMVSAITLTHAEEAIGIVRASVACGVPVVVSFTVETDGRLPNGQSLADAIAETDAATDSAPIYYMINCAHPDHFAALLDGAAWTARIGGVRANASRLSHAELDEAETLDDGDPKEFGELHRAIFDRLPSLNVVGGCCGTDDRHVGCVAHGLLAPAPTAA